MKSRTIATCLALAGVLGLTAGCGSDPPPVTTDSGTDVPVTPDLGTTPDVPIAPDVPAPVDAGPMCLTGERVCDGRCVNPQNDRTHCGACGMACAMGQVCSMGACAVECVTGQTNCGGSCRDTQTDPAHCGACGMACPAGQSCVTGACATVCPMGQTSCGGACRDTQSDRAHCGACDMACAAGQVCSAGMCAVECPAGQNNCGGSCRDTQTDPAHCGACGMACAAGQSCVAGACTTVCPTGQTVCGGSCRDTASDRTHCGGCGMACATGQVCSMGVCAVECVAGQTNCSGSCRDTQTDRAHCGACGMACATGQSCVAGACTTVCPTGQINCSGSCRDLRTDALHCGACGMACGAGRVCDASTCRTLYGSCQEILLANPSSPSGAYWVAPAGQGSAAEVYCDMTTAGGGWTLALKANGANPTFAYDAPIWTNTTLLNPTSVDMTPTDAKFASFLNQPVSEVLVMMTAGGMTRSVVIEGTAANLAALVGGSYRATTLGRTAWLGLLPGNTIQPNCNREGFANSFGDPHARVRIGILGNQEGDCGSTDSWLGVGGNVLAGNGCFGSEARPSVGQVGGGACAPAGAIVTAVGHVFVRERTLARNCREILQAGLVTNGVYTIDPDGLGPVPSTSVYCDQTTDGGGWTLVGRMGDPRYLPQLTRNLGAITAPAGTGNLLHTQYAAIQGSHVRVGRQVGQGTTVGNFYQINDCSMGDAACWYGRFINQNDGDTFGAWLVAGGNWGFVPTGCTNDQCPTSGGDRDHSQAQRIAIFGGDCHSSCNSGGDQTRNGLVYRDYGTAESPSRIGNRAWWGAGTVTSGATGLGSEIPNVDYGQNGTAWRDLWIR